MLFDLRGRGRRRTIQGIYLFLAVLMGGGLIFFGVGGTGVGLFNSSDNGGGGTSSNGVVERQLKHAERAVRRTPREAAAWAALSTALFRDAQANEYSTSSNAYTSAGVAELRRAGRAWDRYLALNPKNPDLTTARLMTSAFETLQDAKGLVSAWEVIVEANPTPGTLGQLARAAYAAGQMRKGDLAAAEAIDRAPKGSKQQVRAQMHAYKTAATNAAANAAGGGTQTAPVTPQPQPKSGSKPKGKG